MAPVDVIAERVRDLGCRVRGDRENDEPRVLRGLAEVLRELDAFGRLHLAAPRENSTVSLPARAAADASASPQVPAPMTATCIGTPVHHTGA